MVLMVQILRLRSESSGSREIGPESRCNLKSPLSFWLISVTIHTSFDTAADTASLAGCLNAGPKAFALI